MKTEYNHDETAVSIIGDYSPHAVVAETVVIDQLGGIESAYHEIKRLQNSCLLPRRGSSVWPLSERDLRYALDNEQRDHQYWQFKHMEGPRVRECTGYDFVHGYGYMDGNEFVFVNGQDVPVFRVICV